MAAERASFDEKGGSQIFQEAKVDEVIKLLKSDSENGLKEAEA